jgi:prepilin-type N-terminal cleavage/methylation domain-containing protein
MRANQARAAMTLMELLAVVAILALVAGMATIFFGGVGQRADEQLATAECAEIRSAVQRFAADMGEPPRLLAELLQSPDPADSMGGWWWRTDGTPTPAYRAFDPATRRGWNGPYLQSVCVSGSSQSTCEARLKSNGQYEQFEANPESGKRLAILRSKYASYPQATCNGRLASHYQLDLTKPDDLAVRFVRDPAAPPAQAGVVAQLCTGVKP